MLYYYYYDDDDDDDDDYMYTLRSMHTMHSLEQSHMIINVHRQA